jgi:NADPH:quinone reductase-like Zn-dependent oxidoreductase
MKAAAYTRYGPPEVVRVVDVPTPAPRDRELLVRVHATTVNRTDCGFRSGRPLPIRPLSGMTSPRVRILGNEFAGRVVEVGRSVTRFAPGDRVFGYDDRRWGAHAEYLIISESASVALIPQDLSYVQAAPGTEGAHYALASILRARIRAGQWALVYGATGAIGSAAVQLMTQLGVHVTAVCDGAHLDLVRGLGAERVIDRTARDFTRDEQPYDVVFDAVGKSTFFRCRRLLKPRGLLVHRLGAALAEPAPFAGHAAAARQVGAVRISTPQSGHDRPIRRPDAVGAVPAGHRPHLLPARDRRGLPVCRDRAEDRQRRHHDRPPVLTRPRFTPGHAVNRYYGRVDRDPERVIAGESDQRMIIGGPFPQPERSGNDGDVQVVLAQTEKDLSAFGCDPVVDDRHDPGQVLAVEQQRSGDPVVSRLADILVQEPAIWRPAFDVVGGRAGVATEWRLVADAHRPVGVDVPLVGVGQDGSVVGESGQQVDRGVDVGAVWLVGGPVGPARPEAA